MKLGPQSLLALAKLEEADDQYKAASAKFEAELRVQLKEKLRALEWERARAARDADNAMKREHGRSVIAAISRAIHSQDHATAKSILAMTEEIKDQIAQGHPDDLLISAELTGDYIRYGFVTADGEQHFFKIVRGEYVGVSPEVADQLDDENAMSRIAEWEARRKK